jgi:dTDP-glucose 4,6-dehydratase
LSKKILITGGAGFIGSHVVRRFVNKYTNYHIYNVDLLTYSGNLENLVDVESKDNYTFIKGDITDEAFIQSVFLKYKFDHVIHLAAESHVDRSIVAPLSFAKTNILGTMVLLNAFKETWKGAFENTLFYHVSTDEVYGTLGEEGLFTEETSYHPNSPYSASKASSDHFVRAYGETYGMPYVMSNCSNNYGANQFPEKLIPLCINNIINKKELPVYGDGKYTRDWLSVLDHAIAIDVIFHQGSHQETYNIGGDNEWQNIDLIKLLCQQMDEKLNRVEGESEKLIRFVKDRSGHDLRYAVDASKINKEFGWKPSVTFEEGLSKTIDWYLANKGWMQNVISGTYETYYNNQYKQR